MARQNALSITTDGTVKDQLAEITNQVIDNIFATSLSVRLKNTMYSGDPTTGSVEFKRFKNAVSQAYGTARAAGAGDLLQAAKSTLNINVDKEIVEEIEAKDVKLYGIGGIMAKRAANHDKVAAAELDRAFFDALVTEGAAHTFSVGADTAVEKFEELVQKIETTKDDYVDGVDRSMIYVSVKPSVYGELKNYLNTLNDRGSEDGEIKGINGVEVISNFRQTADWIVATYETAAQPVIVDEYQDEKINLSNAHAVELFYHYGTKVINPNLVHTA